MRKVRKINGYNITSKFTCKHLDLFEFSGNTNYICRYCKSECQFCEGCEKVFSIRLLSKNGGVCRACNRETVEAFSFVPPPPPLVRSTNADPVPSLSFLLSSLPMPWEEGGGKRNREGDIPKSKEKPVSEIHAPLENKFDEGDFTVKRILDEDPVNKVWLTEWTEGEASWEPYDNIKDTKIFQEYIESKMKNNS